MSNVDMCSHDWPGTGCRECMRESHKAKVSYLEDRLLDEAETRMLAEAELHNVVELSLKANARIEELEAVLSKFVNWTMNEAGTISLGDDVELWELAEKVLENK